MKALSPRNKNLIIFICLIVGFILLETFYFSFAIPFSTTLVISFFWVYFLTWFVGSFILSAILTRSDSGARVMMLIAAMIFIVAGTLAEALPTKLEGIIGPMFPAWYGGLLLFLCAYVTRGNSLMLPATNNPRCSSCGEMVSGKENICSRCGYQFSYSTHEERLNRSKDSECGSFVVRGALSRRNGFYDLYFVENRIVAIKVGSVFSGRKAQKRGEARNLDQLLLVDTKNNYSIPMSELKSIKMSNHDFLSSFSGKSFEITFANSRKTFSMSRRGFRQLQERLYNSPFLRNKLQ